MLDILLDTFLDSLKLLPFLLITYLLMEYLEHKSLKSNTKLIERSGKLGPLWGSILGVLPQCGFSVASSNLYVSRVISLGTLISIYLSTSDEMLVVLLSKSVSIKIILLLVILKVLVGMFFGFLIDFLFRKKNNNFDSELCEREDCHCGSNIFTSSIKHTFNTYIFILGVTFLFNVLTSFVSMDKVSLFLRNFSFLTPFILGVIGLIPSCASSVIITELFLDNVISLGSALAGLFANSGVALAVLFRNNKNRKENFLILGILYIISVVSGIIINIIIG